MKKTIENKSRADFDVLVDSFVEDLNIRNISNVPLITVYFDTVDYPGKYVARIFDIRPGEVYRTRYIMLGEDLQSLQGRIPKELARMPRSSEDDPKIIEVWF